MKPQVLIIDDEVSLCSMLEVFFQKKGYSVATALGLNDAYPFLEGKEPLLAMVDLSLGPDSGLDLVKALIEKFPDLPVIVMTAYGTVAKAVEAIKMGAFDFISKPFEMVFLGKVVEKAISTRTLKKENLALKDLIKRQNTLECIGNSPVMQNLKGKIEAAAGSESTVLITGESGTGKEMVAKLVHQKSARALKSFVVVNCSALSESLLESELFGHMKGAFTSAFSDKEGLFSVAGQGTVFLDEIGEMPIRTQVKLLRVLQEREITPVGGTTSFKIDVRILAATNVDLEEAVKTGRFREDLYYRLNVLRIQTPSLAERGDDAILLARFFLDRKSKGKRTLGPTALEQVRSYRWPGNVRQLENAVERALAFSTETEISSLELDRSSSASSESLPRTEQGATGGGAQGMEGLTPTMIEVEKAYIHWVLFQNNWHKPTAAKILGLDISTLYRKIEKYGLKT